MEYRQLGRSGLRISAMTLGTMGFGGGSMFANVGTGDVKDARRQIDLALEAGVNMIDTADIYSTGRAEKIVGEALGSRRDDVILATKARFPMGDGANDAGLSRHHLIRACEASLRRLGTDYIDLYQLHLNDLAIERALALVPVLEDLVAQGKIRAYGWSTDFAERALAFAEAGIGATTAQFDMSVLSDAPAMVAACESAGLGGIVRGPLAMGLLSGKYHDGRRVGEHDVRASGHEWVPYFRDGRGAPEWLAAVDSVRDILTSDGRTLLQGALAWLWARSEVTVPIPGFRDVAQVTEITGALAHGPLSAEQFAAVEKQLTEIRAEV